MKWLCVCGSRQELSHYKLQSTPTRHNLRLRNTKSISTSLLHRLKRKPPSDPDVLYYFLYVFNYNARFTIFLCQLRFDYTAARRPAITHIEYVYASGWNRVGSMVYPAPRYQLSRILAPIWCYLRVSHSILELVKYSTGLCHSVSSLSFSSYLSASLPSEYVTLSSD